MEPTLEQLESRDQVKKFLDVVGRPARAALKHIKSEWFGRPDEELKGWIDRGRAIAEISDSLGYKLILTQTNKEIEWAKNELEVGSVAVIPELRMYLRALRFFHDFILTTERNADIASSVLAGRPEAIARQTETFVKNARP